MRVVRQKQHSIALFLSHLLAATKRARRTISQIPLKTVMSAVKGGAKSRRKFQPSNFGARLALTHNENRRKSYRWKIYLIGIDAFVVPPQVHTNFRTPAARALFTSAIAGFTNLPFRFNEENVSEPEITRMKSIQKNFGDLDLNIKKANVN